MREREGGDNKSVLRVQEGKEVRMVREMTGCNGEGGGSVLQFCARYKQNSTDLEQLQLQLTGKRGWTWII